MRGRVLGDPAGESSYEKGLYVAGWLKRGPTGIIATNIYCAEETVRSCNSWLYFWIAFQVLYDFFLSSLYTMM